MIFHESRRINPIGSDQPTKSDGIPENESTNGSDGLALFSLYVLISILVNTREELYTMIISYRIPIVGPNQIRLKNPTLGIRCRIVARIPIGSESVWSSD